MSGTARTSNERRNAAAHGLFDASARSSPSSAKDAIDSCAWCRQEKSTACAGSPSRRRSSGTDRPARERQSSETVTRGSPAKDAANASKSAPWYGMHWQNSTVSGPADVHSKTRSDSWSASPESQRHPRSPARRTAGPRVPTQLPSGNSKRHVPAPGNVARKRQKNQKRCVSRKSGARRTASPSMPRTRTLPPGKSVERTGFIS